MAGFFNNNTNRGSSSVFNKINSKINYDTLLVNNSQAIGYIENELKRKIGGGYNDDVFSDSLSLADTTSSHRTKVLAFFQLDYETKKQKLRELATNAEIEFVLTNISNDVISYDDDSKFCYPSDIRKALTSRKGIKSLKDINIDEEELVEQYLETFEDVYSAWGFDDGISAWQYFYQYLIEGYLAFEIIYDSLTKPTKIIGFKELNPGSLYPITQKDANGNIFLEWIQREIDNSNFRTLSDNQIIYLQFSSQHKTQRVSFVESMVKSFNVLRLVEHSKVLWHLMYSAIRLNTKVPIGTNVGDRAREKVKEYLNLFKEDIKFDQDTGEVLVDGQPKLQYYKNYVTPITKDGQSVTVEPMEFSGPDLQDSQLLNYFLDKLKRDSKLPMSRWGFTEGGGTYLLGNDSVSREEITYGKLVNRYRTGFSEIMTKAIYIQMCLNNSALKDNVKLKNSIGIKYNDDQYFQRLKDAEINERGAKTIFTLLEIEEPKDGTFFELELLIKKYMNFSDADLAENKKYKDIRKMKNANGGGNAESDDDEAVQTQSQTQTETQTQAQK